MMNLKLLFFALVQLQIVKSEKHPVRDEIVDEIKLKATSWKPREVSDNPLRHRSVESLKASMGQLGVSEASLGSDMFKSVAQSAMDVFRQITSTMGVTTGRKEAVHKLKQSADGDDDDLPLNFSWRDKMPECLGPIQD